MTPTVEAGAELVRSGTGRPGTGRPDQTGCGASSRGRWRGSLGIVGDPATTVLGGSACCIPCRAPWSRARALIYALLVCIRCAFPKPSTLEII